MNASRITRRIAAALLAPLCLCGAGRSLAEIDEASIAAAKQTFLSRMVEKHGFEKDTLATTLDGISINAKILETIAKPAERVVPWYEYRKIFLTNERIAAGAEFWSQHADEIEAASARYGVTPEMLVAILGVETYFGRRMGSYRVLDALGTLAFAYPPRASFFASELESFLLMTREEGPAVLNAVGSYAGAMGAGQFIPSSFRAYAVDADGDGRRDLWHDWADILASVANYFSEHGWQAMEPVADRATPINGTPGGKVSSGALRLDRTVDEIKRMGFEFSSALPGAAPAALVTLEGEGGGMEYWVGYRNLRVITRYNTSPKYALAAFELSQAIRDAYLAKGAP